MGRATLPQKKTRVLANNLKKARERRGLSTSEASAHLRKARTYVVGLESKAFTPSLAGLNQLAKIYKTSIADLLKGL